MSRDLQVLGHSDLRKAVTLDIAAVCDFREEGWQSMDLSASMLAAYSPEAGARVELLRPNFRRRLAWIRWPRGLGWNSDRFLNRYLDYPRWLRRRTGRFDAYHIVDHSYSHLIGQLPASRTGVFCHDVDLFRAILEPHAVNANAVVRGIARGVLRGFRRAAVVFCSNETVLTDLQRLRLVPPERIVVAGLGVAPEFRYQSRPSDETNGLLAACRPRFLLHVGSCIARKRVDVLLDAFARVRETFPDLHLVQIGGDWTADHLRSIELHNLGSSLRQWRGLSRSALASFYQSAACVVVPSDSEGFGLPLIEALACGAPVVAADIPVFRRNGGAAVTYFPQGNSAALAESLAQQLSVASSAELVEGRLQVASRHSWRNHTITIINAYRKLLASSHGE